MKKEKKEDKFIKQPYYMGGDQALKDFIGLNLNYPSISAVNKIEGDVHLRYDINHKGEVIDTKIIGGLDDACNEEAIRVVKLLKFIVPKTPRGLKVTFHKNITIHFRIKDKVQAPVKLESPNFISNQISTFSYNIIDSKPPENKIQREKYSYTIKL